MNNIFTIFIYKFTVHLKTLGNHGYIILIITIEIIKFTNTNIEHYYSYVI